MAHVEWNERKELMEREGIDGQCSFCGDSALTGFWSGHAKVGCCGHCAVEVLPKLIADSLFHLPKRPDVDKVLDRILVNFWQAVAFRLSRAFAKERDKSSELTKQLFGAEELAELEKAHQEGRL